jgi:hypothetical protein
VLVAVAAGRGRPVERLRRVPGEVGVARLASPAGHSEIGAGLPYGLVEVDRPLLELAGAPLELVGPVRLVGSPVGTIGATVGPVTSVPVITMAAIDVSLLVVSALVGSALAGSGLVVPAVGVSVVTVAVVATVTATTVGPTVRRCVRLCPFAEEPAEPLVHRGKPPRSSGVPTGAVERVRCAPPA